MLQLARLSDREAVEVLAKQVHALHVSWRPDLSSMPDELYPIDRFMESVSAKRLYVAKLNNQIIGYVSLKDRTYDWPGVTRRKVMLIDEFAVHEDYRNQGFGTQMMNDVKALACAFGCSDIQLGVYPQNDAAVAFYQKCGLMIRSIEMQMKL